MTQTATQIPQSTKPTEIKSHDYMSGMDSELTNPFAKALAGENTNHDGGGFLRTPEQRAAIFQKNFKEKEAEQHNVFNSLKLKTQQEIDALRSQLAAQAATDKSAKDEQIALFQTTTEVESIERGQGRKSFLEHIAVVLKNLKSRDADTWSGHLQARIGKKQEHNMTAKVQKDITGMESNLTKYAG